MTAAARRSMVARTPRQPDLVSGPIERARRPQPKASTPLKCVAVLIDGVAVAAAMLAAAAVRGLLAEGPPLPGTSHHPFILSAVSVPVWLVVFGRHRLYQARAVEARAPEFQRVASSILTSVVLSAFASAMLRLQISRSWLLLSPVLAVATVMAGREAFRRRLGRLRRTGRLQRRVIVVGSLAERQLVSSVLGKSPALGYDVVRAVELESDAPLHRLLAELAHADASGLVVGHSFLDTDLAPRALRELSDAGYHIEVLSTLHDVDVDRLTLRSLGDMPVLYLQPAPAQIGQVLAKRAFDVMVACIALVVAAPVLAVLACLVRLDSDGPALFWQERVGYGGRLFRMLKVRSMVVGADDQRREVVLGDPNLDVPLYKPSTDPRVTRVGRWLRRFSLDELPQLWNVLKGEMSLVGPRPALPSEVAHWDEALFRRLSVRPGMTGMWQTRGRGDATFEEYARFDLYYVENWSIWVDFAIIVRTIPAVVFGRGAR